MTHDRLFFPHPVLRPGGIDYSEECSFVSEIPNNEVPIRGGSIHVRVRNVLRSEFLTGLVREGRASYFSIIKCQKTGQRRTLKSGNSSYDWELRQDDFRGRLSLLVYVVSEAEISPFTSDEHMEDIRGIARSVPAGSILAMSQQIDIPLDKIEGGLSAAIELVEDEKIPEDSYSVDLDHDLIQVRMSRKAFRYTKLLRARFENILIPMLYVPAIGCAITQMGRPDSGLEDKLWYDAVRSRLEDRGISVEDISPEEAGRHAQALMDSPYRFAAGLLGEDDANG